MGKLGGMILIGAAALAGSYVGDNLRDGSEADMGQLMTGASTGIALALVAGWPRMLFAFIGGLAGSLLLDESTPLGKLLSS